MIPRYFVVAERDHVLQNPISEEKLRLLGERLRLGPGSRVLDVASGRGGPAVLLATEFGCAVEGIEIAPEFHSVAVERAAYAGLADRVTFDLADASRVTFDPESYDVAMCLGASFVFGGLAGTLDALEPAVHPGGHVVVGEPYWRRWPLPGDYEDRDDPFTSLEGTVTILESGGTRRGDGHRVVRGRLGSLETLHWRACEEWLAANPDDPDAAEIRARHGRSKGSYLRYGRDCLGWAIIVGWKRS